jgi:hypothetical protein
MAVAVSIRNASDHRWDQSEAGSIRAGNHWRDREGAMLIQDDGRAALPDVLSGGQTCRVILNATAPREAGEYQLEIDVVHEGISWFADKGSQTWRCRIIVKGEQPHRLTHSGSDANVPAASLALPDESSTDEPGALPMFGIHHDIVASLIESHGARIVHREEDERCGEEWIGYRYFVRRE